MKKVKLLALVLVAAFAVTGMAYAYWTQTLAVSGTVSTGNLDLAWNGLFAGVEQNGDYASATIAVDPSNNKVLNVTISNAYPGWQGKFNVGYTNLGTVPGKIDSVTVVNLPPQLTLNKDGIPVGQQVEYDRTVTGNFLVTVKPDLGNETMNQTYTFSVQLAGSQFNAPVPLPASPSN